MRCVYSCALWSVLLVKLYSFPLRRALGFEFHVSVPCAAFDTLFIKLFDQSQVALCCLKGVQISHCRNVLGRVITLKR